VITVLFVQGSAERAGAERVLLALLRSLDRDRVRPVVAFCADGPFVKEVAEAGIEVLRLPSAGRLRQVTRIPVVVRVLAAVIRATGADVVQATGEKMAVYAGWAARSAGRPCVFWLHDAPAPWRAPAQLGMALTPRAEVVACAQWVATAARRRLGVVADAVANGIEPAPLAAAAEGAAALRRDLGFSTDEVVVAHAARLTPWKGCATFLHAASRVARTHPRVRFLVVGGALEPRDEAYAAGLPGLATSLGLGDAVRFLGHRDDALTCIGAADVIVHASRRADPFPTVIVEAAALGRAIVATQTRGPEEIIKQGRTGLLVPPGNAAEMAEATRRVVASPELRKVLGAAAAADAASRWSATRMSEQFTRRWVALAAR